MTYFQTGDVLYKEIDSIPDSAKLFESNLIHQGNDHQHLIEGSFKLYKDNEDLYIQADEECSLLHDEHKTIKLKKGLYKKDIVIEYDHFLEESRDIID